MPLFGKATTYKATNIVTSDEMVLKMGSQQDARTEFLIQNVSIQYNQPITRLFEIGTSYVYFAPGRSLGSFQVGRIIGRYAVTEIFGQPGTGPWTTDLRTGDAQSRTLTFVRRATIGPGVNANNTDQGLNLNYILNGCVIESYSVATDANGLLVQENVSGQFAGLNLVSSSSSGTNNRTTATSTLIPA